MTIVQVQQRQIEHVIDQISKHLYEYKNLVLRNLWLCMHLVLVASPTMSAYFVYPCQNITTTMYRLLGQAQARLNKLLTSRVVPNAQALLPLLNSTHNAQCLNY